MFNITTFRFCRNFANTRLLHQVQPLEKRAFQEVKIPVPWGHIAGKWWGDTTAMPAIGLHGWEDNAGTFDTLAPLLKLNSFLALDLPGHGMSSYLPMGKPYYHMDSVALIRRIVKYFNWDKITLIGHSNGSYVSYVYSASFPGSVENYVSIDCVRTLMCPDEHTEVLQMKNAAIKISSIEAKMLSKEPPSYDYETIIETLRQGLLESPTKESCKILLQRGSRVASDPDKFCFTRDPRLRFWSFGRLPHEYLLALASNIQCNFLGIRGAQGLVEDEAHDRYLETVERIRKPQYKFEHYDIDGSHHIQLNNPERVAPIINKFLGLTY